MVRAAPVIPGMAVPAAAAVGAPVAVGGSGWAIPVADGARAVALVAC